MPVLALVKSTEAPGSTTPDLSRRRPVTAPEVALQSCDDGRDLGALESRCFVIVPSSGVFLPGGCAKVSVADAAGAQKCRRFIRKYYHEDKLGVCGGERMKSRRPR